jgi:hypothetical protein
MHNLPNESQHAKRIAVSNGMNGNSATSENCAAASQRSANPARKLDFIISCYNRPKFLHHYLASGLACDIPGAHFVVFDDASDLSEEIPGLGMCATEDVCRSFNDTRVIYIRNPVNMGVARSLVRYHREFCSAEYVSLQNPKDEFIDRSPIGAALAKLDADPALSLVVYPVRQSDRKDRDAVHQFFYRRMSGREFIATYVRDPALQHSSSYAIMRVSALRKCNAPRNLDLRALGLEDGSGIDHDMLFNAATTGDVDFESVPPLRRNIVGGYTELYPLTFAYTQYQYARRLMLELEPRGFVSAETRRIYLGFWLLNICRGLVISYRPVHGSELEHGVTRIRPHLPMPILLYLPWQYLRFRIVPTAAARYAYYVGSRLLLRDWMKQAVGRMRGALALH